MVQHRSLGTPMAPHLPKGNEQRHSLFPSPSPRIPLVWFIDEFVLGGAYVPFAEEGGPECNPADLAEPFGELDIADVVAFLQLFGVNDPAADIADPIGAWDISDVVAFLQLFGVGCP